MYLFLILSLLLLKFYEYFSDQLIVINPKTLYFHQHEVVATLYLYPIHFHQKIFQNNFSIPFFYLALNSGGGGGGAHPPPLRGGPLALRAGLGQKGAKGEELA